MLLEGYKFNVNPKKPRYRVKGSMPAAKAIEKFAKKKATRYAIGTFIAGAAMERIAAPHVTKAKRWLVRKDIERQNKKFAKKAAKMQKQRMNEGYLWGKIKPALEKSKAGSRILAKHGPKVQKAADVAWGGRKLVTGHAARLATKHPIVAAGLGVAAAVGGSAAKDVAKHYIAHKAKMRTDPVYAQKARKAAEREKALRQAKKIKEAYAGGGRTSPAPEARTTAHKGDEHPSPQAYKMGKKGHKKHHAHHAVMRSMQPNTINTAGLAGGKFQLTDRTKTNTRKESYMNLDNVIERTVDNLCAIDEDFKSTARTVKSVAKTVWKNRGVIARGLRDKARIGVQKAADYGAGKYQMYKMKRRPVSEAMSERAGDIYEIGPLAFGLIKAGSKMAAGYAAKKAAGAVKKKIMPKREDIEELAPAAAWALKNPGKTASAIGAAIKYSPVGLAAKMTKRNIKKFREGVDVAEEENISKSRKRVDHLIMGSTGREITKAVKRNYRKTEKQGTRKAQRAFRKAQKKVTEAMAPGARSQFEINKVKDVRQFYGMQRSQHVDAAAAKAIELRKKINKRGGAEVKESAKDILQKARGFAKKYPRTAKGAGVMAATLAASEVLKRHRGFQAKKAEFHHRKYRRAAARHDYLTAKKQNKAELKAALREATVDKVAQYARDKAKRLQKERAKALLDRRFAAKKKKVEEARVPNPDWRRERIEKWKAKEAERKKDKKKDDDNEKD